MRLFPTLVSVFALLGAACAHAQAPAPSTHAQDVQKNWSLLENYCAECHNAVDWAGGVAFDTLQPESVPADAEVWEEAVRKLRGRMMPPPGKKQPDAATLNA